MCSLLERENFSVPVLPQEKRKTEFPCTENKRRTILNAANIAFITAFPMLSALVFLGIGYGIYMRTCGFSAIWPICMAATIFTGSMEFITVGLLVSTFNPLYALLLTLIVNGRHMFYGIAMLNKYNDTGWKKTGLVSGLIDEAFSLNYMADIPSKTNRSWFMLFISLFLYISWISGTVIGAVSGSTAISEIKGIEFVMPALFIVIFISQWQKESSHGSSILGVAVAVVCLPLFGKAYFMLPTLLFVAILFTVRWLMVKDKTKLS